jgi:uncharacterized protein (TIGR02147 family)
MRIYEFLDYKAFIESHIRSLPERGRGEKSRIANALGIHTTMVTHVLKGKLQFTLEQTLKLADHWALNELETEFLVALVQLDRAGDKRAKSFCRKRVDELRARARNLSQRLNTQNELSEDDRAKFYSNWIYAGIRLLSATDQFATPAAMAELTNLPLSTVRTALDFLVTRGLCTEEDGSYRYGPTHTYLEATSPLVATHHLNWRRKAAERFDRLRAEDLVFTYPVVMSEKDFLSMRETLVQFIEEFKKTVTESPSEQLYCLNLDWLKIFD